MNNPTFREYIAVDERNRPRKQQNSVYARYEDRRTEKLCLPTEKVADANTRAELRRTGVTFDNGEIYTRVKISSATNSESVKIFQKSLQNSFCI